MTKTVTDFPELVAQWHLTKNGDLKPSDVSYGSDRRVWWKCSIAHDHEWDACVSSRTITGSKCPFCSNQKVCQSNCLSTTHPHLVSQWHSKNDIKPDQVVAGSTRKVWWKCDKEDDHEWEAQINNRAIVGSGCPCCNGKKVVPSNSLAVNRPDLAAQWHPTKNGELTPLQVLAGGDKKVWWRCDKGHDWCANIYNRTCGAGCPYCSNKEVCEDNCLQTVRPDLAAQWHPTKNGELTPSTIVAGSGKKVWWKCDEADDHEWKSSPATRISENTGCPCCSGRKAVISNSIATTHPHILDEWHPNKNDILPTQITAGSSQSIWWRCSKGHEWQSPVAARISGGNGCPYCGRKKVCADNCLSATHPEIAAEWHPTKNGDLTPNDVLSGINMRVWWRCSEDHEWQSSIIWRTTKNTGCPTCSGRVACKDHSCLAVECPEVAVQWHPTKNGDLTPYDVLAGTPKRVWWKCDKEDDHEWLASICNRSGVSSNTDGTGCPFCGNRKVCKSNCLATIRPDLAAQWHTTKNGDLTPADVTISKGKVWWKCDKADDHEWEAAIFSRVRDNRGCPYCANQKTTTSNCLAVTHPHLLSMWHPKNTILPTEINAGSNAKVWWKCDKADDHEWEAPVYRLAQKDSSCPCCCGKKVVKSNCLATTQPQLAAEWHPTKNGNLTPSDVMAGGAAKVWWKCSKGHEWKAQLATRSKGCGCPVCCESKGEKRIAAFLDSKQYNYERQVKFDGCRYRNKLPFDFGVQILGKLHLIEYQGEQHYQPVAFGSKQDDPVARFRLTKRRDKIKEKYCSDNDIPLLTIPYWKRDDTEMMVSEFLGGTC